MSKQTPFSSPCSSSYPDTLASSVSLPQAISWREETYQHELCSKRYSDVRGHSSTLHRDLLISSPPKTAPPQKLAPVSKTQTQPSVHEAKVDDLRCREFTIGRTIQGLYEASSRRNIPPNPYCNIQANTGVASGQFNLYSQPAVISIILPADNPSNSRHSISTNTLSFSVIARPIPRAPQNCQDRSIE